MKYEKYLIQVCKSMLHDFEVVQCCNALDVPKDFVENSKATTWYAILKKYQEKKSGSINSKNE